MKFLKAVSNWKFINLLKVLITGLMALKQASPQLGSLPHTAELPCVVCVFLSFVTPIMNPIYFLDISY